MHITFAPEGDDEQKREWEFKGHRLLTSEAEAVEKATGISWVEFSAKLMQRSPTALRGLVWVLRKREEPTLRYSAVDFPIGDVTMELDEEEKADIRATILRAPGITDDERRAAIAELGVADESEDADPNADLPD